LTKSKSYEAPHYALALYILCSAEIIFFFHTLLPLILVHSPYFSSKTLFTGELIFRLAAIPLRSVNGPFAFCTRTCSFSPNGCGSAFWLILHLVTMTLHMPIAILPFAVSLVIQVVSHSRL
jgi:hypothetical protein